MLSSSTPVPMAAGPPHFVDLHVNPGESVSIQFFDGNETILRGPTTIKMVSNHAYPPMPLPVQVPPGHMIQQIVDETGTLRHIILSALNGNGTATTCYAGHSTTSFSGSSSTPHHHSPQQHSQSNNANSPFCCCCYQTCTGGSGSPNSQPSALSPVTLPSPDRFSLMQAGIKFGHGTDDCTHSMAPLAGHSPVATANSVPYAPLGSNSYARNRRGANRPFSSPNSKRPSSSFSNAPNGTYGATAGTGNMKIINNLTSSGINSGGGGRSYHGHNNVNNLNSSKTVDNPKSNQYSRQSNSTTTSFHYDATGRPLHSESVANEGGHTKYYLNKSYDYSCNSSNASQASVSNDHQMTDHLKYYKDENTAFYRDAGDAFATKKTPSFQIGKGILTKDFFLNHRPNHVSPSSHEDHSHRSSDQASNSHHSPFMSNLELNIPKKSAESKVSPSQTSRTDLANSCSGVKHTEASPLSSATGDVHQHRNHLPQSQRTVVSGRNNTNTVDTVTSSSTKPNTNAVTVSAPTETTPSECYSKQSSNKVFLSSSRANSRTKVSSSKVFSPAKKKSPAICTTTATPNSGTSASSSAEVSPSPPPKPQASQAQPQPSINIPVIISEPPTDDDLSTTNGLDEEVQNKSSCDEGVFEEAMPMGTTEEQSITRNSVEAVTREKKSQSDQQSKAVMANGNLGTLGHSSTEQQSQSKTDQYMSRSDDSEKSDSDPYVEANEGNYEDDEDEDDEDERNSSRYVHQMETAGHQQQQRSPRHLLPKVETIFLSSSSLSSHSVRLKWVFPGQITSTESTGEWPTSSSELKKPHFIVDMVRGNVDDSPSSRIVYQGPNVTCRVPSLSPQTKYSFRVRSNTDTAVLVSNVLTVVTEQFSSGGLRRRTKQQGQQTQGQNVAGAHQSTSASANHHNQSQVVLSADGKSVVPAASASEVLMRARLSQDQRCAILLLAVFTFTALIIAVLVQHCLGAPVN